ncbi:MAG: hypothetical protein Q8L68_03355 [Methylococcales bacterium]|nr:hypothetical protein [Methylococcales bacterium]
MRWYVLLKRMIPTLLCCVSMDLFSLNLDAQEIYPKVLLKKDYGILSKDELGAYARYVKPALHAGKIDRNYPYWQCFPREHVTITLIDKGYSSEDIGNIDNYGAILITAWSSGGISNEYSMRRPWAVDEEEEIFHRWQKLMKNEKYVCLAGSIGRAEEKITNNKRSITYFWIFERIKTKKGCDAYFQNQCNRNYSQAKAVPKT